MKKARFLLYALPFVLILLVVLGGFWLREALFPKAPVLEVPGEPEVLSVTVHAHTDPISTAVDLDAAQWEPIRALLSQATPTRGQSVNDHPAVRPYYEVVLHTAKGQSLYFIYSDAGQICLEVPYEGIYKADPELLDLVVSTTSQVAQPTDLIPMVLVDGILYLDTGHESTVTARCGMLDGEITSTVESWEQPTEDDQSNFGTGYGYQKGAEADTLELYINGKWWVFQAETTK